MTKVLIKMEGNARTYVRYDGLYHNALQHFILIYNSLIVEQPGIPTIVTEQKPMRIDNTTPVPMVDLQGQPIMETVQQPTGLYVTVTPDPVLDEAGNTVQGDPYTDFTQPIFEPVEVQKTIGEYAKCYWEWFDKRNISSKGKIEAEVEEGILRRMGAPTHPYVFVQTPEWLATQ